MPQGDATDHVASPVSISPLSKWHLSIVSVSIRPGRPARVRLIAEGVETGNEENARMSLASENTLIETISPHEQMAFSGIEHYFQVGRSASLYPRRP